VEAESTEPRLNVSYVEVYFYGLTSLRYP